MLCCVIAAALVVKILVRWRSLAKYLGFAVPERWAEPYGYAEYGELDMFDS